MAGSIAIQWEGSKRVGSAAAASCETRHVHQHQLSHLQHLSYTEKKTHNSRPSQGMPSQDDPLSIDLASPARKVVVVSQQQILLMNSRLEPEDPSNALDAFLDLEETHLDLIVSENSVVQGLLGEVGPSEEQREEGRQRQD
jgi:hypothetical protein